jgi:hypothetical protein
VDVADIGDSLPAPNQSPFEPTGEFKDWMKFLDAQERETMTLRFVSRGICVPLGAHDASSSRVCYSFFVE